MRFLKHKVFNQAQQKPTKGESPQRDTARSPEVAAPRDSLPAVAPKSISKHDSPKNQRSRVTGQFVTPYSVRCTKNIVKNYGRAICTFASSTTGKPYLEEILKRNNFNVSIEEFNQFVEANKEVVDSIERFKNMMLITKEDPPKLAACKQIFRLMGEVFIKYFSVNWIFSSKIVHKQPHLQFRFKLLRRLRNPELFTYLKPFSKK